MICSAWILVVLLSIALILYDIITNKHKDLQKHIVAGIVLSTLFYIACSVLGETLSLGVLVIPCIFILVEFIKESTTVKPVVTEKCLEATPAPKQCPPPVTCSPPPMTCPCENKC
jgi:predicted membrane protein